MRSEHGVPLGDFSPLAQHPARRHAHDRREQQQRSQAELESAARSRNLRRRLMGVHDSHLRLRSIKALLGSPDRRLNFVELRRNMH